MDRGELHRDTEGDGGHYGELVRRVHALDVEGRVRFGIAEALRFLENVRKARSFSAHLRQDEVARAVDDAGDPFDAVGAQPFAQGFNDRNAAADRPFERHHHVFLLCRREDLVAVLREQRLVRGDDMLAVRDRSQDQLLGDAGAADQLDDDVDVGMVDHLAAASRHDGPLTDDTPCLFHVLVGNHLHGDRAAGAPADLLLVAREHGKGTAADGPDPQQPHIYGFHDPEGMRDEG
jgi:hypothetical protein